MDSSGQCDPAGGYRIQYEDVEGDVYATDASVGGQDPGTINPQSGWWLPQIGSPIHS